jgi:response regulator RpfG family c-di-GMP phosphodiesterase
MNEEMRYWIDSTAIVLRSSVAGLMSRYDTEEAARVCRLAMEMAQAEQLKAIRSQLLAAAQEVRKMRRIARHDARQRVRWLGKAQGIRLAWDILKAL